MRRPPVTDFAGFTLIELVIVMVLVGILGAVVVMFGNPVTAAVDGQRRAEMADAADLAYRRIARDIRRALPNSLVVTANSIEFIATTDGGRYQDVTDNLDAGSLRFDDDTQTTFNVLGPMPTIQNNDYIVINNWRTGNLDAYCAGETCNNRARVSVAGTTLTMIDGNPYDNLGESARSPGNRFHVVSQNEQAITYRCNGTTLERHWRYGFTHTLGAPGSVAILAKNVTCNFAFVPFDSQLWGLLHLQFSLSRNDVPGTPVTLVYQLHVDNTP